MKILQLLQYGPSKPRESCGGQHTVSRLLARNIYEAQRSLQVMICNQSSSVFQHKKAQVLHPTLEWCHKRCYLPLAGGAATRSAPSGSLQSGDLCFSSTVWWRTPLSCCPLLCTNPQGAKPCKPGQPIHEAAEARSNSLHVIGNTTAMDSVTRL